MANVKIIDYKAGNAPSVMHAVNRLGVDAAFARKHDDLDGATHIILPGVGSAGTTMKSLEEMGIIDALKENVLSAKKALFLGICVGMQILFEHSEEEDARCLGWLKGRVVKFDSSKVRVPQMGWNQVRLAKSPLCESGADYFYFVNSYYALLDDGGDIWGVTDYGGTFVSAVRRENIFGVQFHAEKSGEAGLELLRGFINWGRGDGR
jgi:glutamine amidotransferase